MGGMTHIVPGWVHQPGRHCGSTALSNLTHFYGLNYSEALCFGLGAGLGFFFFPVEGMTPSRLIGTRSASLEPNFFNLIGRPFNWKTEESVERAAELLKEQIDAGVPVLIQCDLKYLHYYKTQTSFSGHVILVWGYDDEKQVYFVSDTHFPGLQEVGYADMIRARTSQAFPMPVCNNWFPGTLDGVQGSLADLGRQAMRLNAHEMTENSSFIAKKGVQAIRALAEDLPGWGSLGDRKWCARFTYQVIEKRGTGGGAFRLLYAEFLKEMEAHVTAVRELNLASRMLAIGREWSRISTLLKEESDRERPETLADISEKVARVADQEESVYETVLAGIA